MSEVRGVDIVRWLEQNSFRVGKQPSDLFTEMLDKFIDFLSLDRLRRNGMDTVKVMKSIKNDPFFELYSMWLEWVYERQQKEGVVDAFDFYEGSFKSKGKADVLGQFYTPMHLCHLMGEIVKDETEANEVQTVLDCAVGSGRTLLGHYQMHYMNSSTYYYVGGDIDSQSVKMCAINMCINGMLGRSICGDALLMEFRYGYEINEMRYPYPTPICSISEINPPHWLEGKERYNYCMSIEPFRRELLNVFSDIKRNHLGEIREKNNANIPQKLTQIKDMPIEKSDKPKYGKYEQLTIF